MATVDSAELGRASVRIGEIALPAPFAPDRAEFRRAAMVRLVPFARKEEVDPAARRRLALLERDLERAAGSQPGGDLTARLDSSLRVLEARGLADGWALLERGRALTSIHNEADLLVVEALAAGHMEGVGASMLAALVSCLTYRKRGPGEPSTVRLRGGFGERFGSIVALAAEIAVEERSVGMEPVDPPDPGFAHLIHAWADGAELDEVLEDAMTGGEFVRNVRLVADLLRQLAKVASPSLADVAEVAGGRLNRGVVALSIGAPSSENDIGQEAAG